MCIWITNTISNGKTFLISNLSQRLGEEINTFWKSEGNLLNLVKIQQKQRLLLYKIKGAKKWARNCNPFKNVCDENGYIREFVFLAKSRLRQARLRFAREFHSIFITLGESRVPSKTSRTSSHTKLPHESHICSSWEFDPLMKLVCQGFHWHHFHCLQ